MTATPRDGEAPEALDPEEEAPPNLVDPDDSESVKPSPDNEARTDDDGEPPRLGSAGTILKLLVGVVVVLAIIYFLLPQIAGMGDTLKRIESARWQWVVVGLGLSALSYGCYVVQFHAFFSRGSKFVGWSVSYQISLAGTAATRLVSPGGAGGLALAYWALRRAGYTPLVLATRMLGFLVLQYSVYMFSLIIAGILLRTHVLSGPAPAGMTIAPAAMAGGIVLFFLAMAMIPEDLGRRMEQWVTAHTQKRGSRVAKVMRWIGTAPATLGAATRLAILYARTSWMAVAGAVGWWAFDIAVLWSSFRAFGGAPPIGVLVLAYFVGTVANLLPFFPAGVGAVDAGLIGALIALGVPADITVVSVLLHRMISFWLPTVPGVVAFFQIRRTVQRWRAA